MGLLARLQGDENPKIAVHTFWSAMVEIDNGEVTVQQVKNYFEMDADTSSDFDWLIGKYNDSTNKYNFVNLMHVIFILAEVKTTGYATEQALIDRINRIP